MDIILPVKLYNEQDIVNCALQLNIDEFTALKLVFMIKHCDIDVFETLGDERIQQLLYGWEMCTLQLCNLKAEISPQLAHMVKLLAHLTLHLWFSQEWTHCNNTLKEELLICLDQGQYIFGKIAALSIIDWKYLLSLGLNPWSLVYLQNFGQHIKQNKQHEIEHIVPLATEEDKRFLQQEGVLIIYMRLVKLFNAGSWESVKQLSLRVLISWLDISTNAIRTKSNRNENDAVNEKRGLILIGHMYLMTIFVADDNRGYKIDNMMHNIRFYCQNIQFAANTDPNKSVEYTPARLIAKICLCLGVNKNEFFEHFVFHAYDTSFTTLFGVISQTYISYVLGNMLMELMAMNEQNFSVHMEEFKLIIKNYVNERERSEKYLLNELKKLASQKTSWALPSTVNMNLDFKSLICKGNRASNFGNYNYDEDGSKIPTSTEGAEMLDEERTRKIDPIFQNIPNNEKVLCYVYDILAKRTYKGWNFAQVVLLLKIIGHKMNKIETWRYHPGLSTEFMLSLEKQLSAHYADLARIFMEFPFMEQELWLTAFYLHPNRKYYDEVKRCGLRWMRRRQATNDYNDGALPGPASSKQDLTKFGLLSSTIYVKEIVRISNHEEPNSDYEPIAKALIDLRLPEGVCKDLLTLIYLARNNSFSWALEWHELRDRCRTLIKDSKIKKRFVELDMAEANDRLKFLKIDYEKYKHRPQLDYGTIEEGYENVLTSAEGGGTSNKVDDDDDSEFDCDTKEKVDGTKPKPRTRRKFWDEESISDGFEEDSNDSEAYYTGSRRTRARAAAVIATTMFKDGLNKRNIKSKRGDSGSASSAPSPPVQEPLPATGDKSTKEVEKKKFNEVLETRVHYGNTTNGFEKVTDIWDFAKEELQSVDVEANILMESRSVLEQIKTVKSLRKIVPKNDIFREEKEDMKENFKGMHEINNMHALMIMKDDLKKEEHEELFQKTTEQDSDSSFRSDTSTQAHKDFDESIYDDGTNDDPRFNNQEGNEPADNVVKNNDLKNEQPPHQTAIEPTTKMEDQHEVMSQTSLDNDKLNLCEQDKLLDSITGDECDLIDEVDEFNESMIKDFTAKPLRVILRRLRANEILQLRQPRVRIKRLNLDEVNEMQKNIKRRKLNGSTEASQYNLTDEGSGNSSVSSIQSESLGTRTQRRHRTPKSFLNYKSNFDTDDNASCSAPKRRKQRQLIATTRSASGLKMRISSLKEATEQTVPVECIQLSSTSSSPIAIEDCEAPIFHLSPIPENMIIDIQENDPLYEEEIVPYR